MATPVQRLKIGLETNEFTFATGIAKIDLREAVGICTLFKAFDIVACEFGVLLYIFFFSTAIVC